MFINSKNLSLAEVETWIIDHTASSGWGWATPLYIYDFSVDGTNWLAGQTGSFNLSAKWLKATWSEKYIYFNSWASFWVPIKARFKIMLDQTTSPQSFDLWVFVNGRQGNRGWFAIWGHTEGSNFVVDGYWWNSNAGFLIGKETATPWATIALWQALWIDVRINSDNSTSGKVSLDWGATRSAEQNIWWFYPQNRIGVWSEIAWTAYIQRVEVYNYADI